MSVHQQVENTTVLLCCNQQNYVIVPETRGSFVEGSSSKDDEDLL